MSFNFMAAVTALNDFGAQENKVCHCFYFSPTNCHEVTGPDAMILVSWVQSLSTLISEPPKIVCHCFHIFPIYLP